MEIKPLERSHCNPDRESISVNIDDLNNIEADYKEAIEALVKVQLFAESIYNTEISETAYKGIIEKAYGEKWEDIWREK